MSVATASAQASSRDERFHVRFLWAVTLLSGAVLWLRPIASSFWEDELVTWWVVDGSFREMLHRSYALQGQSALYYPIAWLVRQVGDKEWMLRLPIARSRWSPPRTCSSGSRRGSSIASSGVWRSWPSSCGPGSRSRRRTRGPTRSPCS
jgi:hypothetical protein